MDIRSISEAYNNIYEDFKDLTPDKEKRVMNRMGELTRDVQVLGAKAKEIRGKPLAKYRPKLKKDYSDIVKSAKKKANLVRNASDAVIRTSTSRSAAIQHKINKLKEDLVLERYYEPHNDKLPSGKTPMQKALQKSKNRARTIGGQSVKNQDRWAKQYDDTRTKVTHGADNPKVNPNVSWKDRDEISIEKNDDGDEVYVTHKPTKTNYSISANQVYDDASDKTKSHTIAWAHDNKIDHRDKDFDKKRLRVARNAKNVWDKHVEPRLPSKSIVHNEPASSYDERGRIKSTNRRSEIYKRAGFGDLGSDGDQFAKVGRNPSPKQKEKGKKRLSPLDPHLTRTNLGWNDELGWDD
jgi:hypothetical protein